jgi:hypothetical protein
VVLDVDATFVTSTQPADRLAMGTPWRAVIASDPPTHRGVALTASVVSYACPVEPCVAGAERARTIAPLSKLLPPRRR